MSGGRWRLNLLGGCTLHDPAGRTVPLPGPAAMRLLARLALPPQRAWAREALVELLWPGVALEVGRNRLRQLLLGLRRTLERAGGPALLEADRLTLRLRPGALECDVEPFEAALRARPGAAAVADRGELLPGLTDEWIEDERRRLAALAQAPAPDARPAPARSALPRYLTRLLGADAAAARLQALVGAHRLVTLVGPGGAGKTRLAVEVAARFEAAGQPFERVRFVPLAACAGPDAMLDAVLVACGLAGGRSLQALVDALAGRRLLLVLDNFEQLVDGGAGLVARLAEALPLAHWLVTSRRVLGLDGERECPLATLPLPPPRAGLEVLARNPALALLLDRAQAVRPGLRLTPDNAAALAELVTALDGLPLALELAAPRLRSLAPAQLLARLRAHASPQPLAALARSGPRSGHDPRHASMLKVVAWSGSLLSAPARALLADLALVDAPFELALAEALHGADPALGLDELVQHSLLRADPSEGGRFVPYALVREAAAAALPPARRVRLRARHRAWLTAWARRLPATPSLPAVRRQLPHLVTAVVGAADDGADAEALALWEALQRALSDISLPPAARAALEACVDRGPEPAARAAVRAGLARAAMRAGDAAASARLAEAALAELPAAGLPRATVLARVAHIRWRLRRDAAVGPWLDEALAIARTEGALALQASVLSVQGALRRPQDPDAAVALQRAAIAAWQAAGDGHGVNIGRYNLAVALAQRPATRAEALAECDGVIAATRAAEDWGPLATACNQRGELLSWARRWDEAVAAYREGIEVADAAMEPLPLAYCLWNLPGALAHRREPERAARLMGFAARFWSDRFSALTASDHHDRRRVLRLVAAQVGAARAQALAAEGEALPLEAALRLAAG